MRGKKIFLKPYRLTITFETSYIEYLTQLAIETSAKERKPFTMTEMIREAIEVQYPPQKNHCDDDVEEDIPLTNQKKKSLASKKQ